MYYYHMKRLQKNIILKDLEKKIVLLVGPRQAGKTWLAKDILKEFKSGVYLNYDNLKDRKIIEQQNWLESTDILVLDELHKMPEWKNYLKGVFDTKPSTLRLLVTGSARLDIYDKIGDSLAGRYFRHQLMPLSLKELGEVGQEKDILRLLKRGGFPEPYCAENDVEADRWREQYVNSLLSTDIFEIDTIHNLKGMRLLLDLLRHRVGAPISYRSLSEDLGVSPTTVKKYIQILESLYVIFVVTPYSKNIARSLLKEPKIYFFDNALVEGEGAKVENLVAISLLKSLYGRRDSMAERCSLHYLRTKDGVEVDFAVIKDDQVEEILEVKTIDDSISKPLKKFKTQYNHPATQLVMNLQNEYQSDDIKVLKMSNYLARLYL